MAAAALERLEREINGEAAAPARAPLPVRPLLEAAVGALAGPRGARRRLAGAALAGRGGGGRRRPLRARAGARQPRRQRDRARRARDRRRGRGRARQAAPRGDRLRPRLAPGAAARGGRPSCSPASPAARRHGHGLRVVRRTAAAHGGDFRAAMSRACGPRRSSSCRSPPGRRRVSRRGRALAFVARGPGSPPSRQRRSPTATAPASPAATASCGRSWSPRRARAGPGDRPRRGAAALELRRVPARFVPPGALRNPGRGDRPGAGGGDPGRLLPARLAAAAAAGATGPARLGSGAVGGRSRSRSAAPTRCWWPAPSRSGRGSTWWSRPNRAAPAPAAPTSPPRRCRCWRWGRAAKGRGRRTRGGDARPDPRPGAAADRRRELRPPGDPAAAGLSDGGARAERRRAGRGTAAAPGRAPSRRGGRGRASGGDLRDAVRELVDEEAVLLGAGDRGRAGRRGSSATASASARSRCCSPTRAWRR